METYVDGKYVRKLKAKNVVCHLWDGETCLGEKYLYKEGGRVDTRARTSLAGAR